MPTAESEEFTSPIVYIPKTSYHPNSSFSCLWPVKHSSERPAVKLARPILIAVIIICCYPHTQNSLSLSITLYILVFFHYNSYVKVVSYFSLSLLVVLFQLF